MNVQGSKESAKKSIPLNHRLSFWVVVLLLVLTFASYRFCNDYYQKHKSKPAVPVVVAQAKSQTVPVYLYALGTVTPTYNVTVRTQISGILTNVLFQEGQMVKAGDLLAQIDARPYQAQLIEYEGQLVRDQALLKNALIDLTRYETLWKQDSVSQQTLNTQTSLVKQYEGTVQIDQGLIEATKLNLTYCNITSPIDGRVGLRLVDPGNYIQTTDANGIAVITTLDPITVIFTLPEDAIQSVLSKIYNGDQFTVDAFDRTQKNLLATGELLTMDNQIDPTTGTVRLRAKFENPKNILFPSQFVNIRLLANTLNDAVVVPTAAVQLNAKGDSYLFVVDAIKQVVTVKQVKTGVTTGDYTVIQSGIKVGDNVVTTGADKLEEGAKVMLSHPSASL